MTSINPFDIYKVENASEPFVNNCSDNDYLCFEKLVGRYGVYVFQHKETQEVFYIGEAHTQDLKTRITQNYRVGDTGGTFRIDWLKKEEKNLSDFKIFLSDCEIKTISINTESKKLISAIESILIASLNPKYNKDK
jgi:hypothetical protein